MRVVKSYKRFCSFKDLIEMLQHSKDEVNSQSENLTSVLSSALPVPKIEEITKLDLAKRPEINGSSTEQNAIPPKAIRSRERKAQSKAELLWLATQKSL